VDRGAVPAGFGTLRSFSDSFTNEYREELKKTPPRSLMLTAALGTSKKTSKVDTSTEAAAASLRGQIDSLIKKPAKK
jgi:hypothetical protein